MPVAGLGICYVIDSLAASGGAEQALAAMAPRLVEAGVRLDVVYLEDRPGLHDQLCRAGAQLFPLFDRTPIKAIRLVTLLRRRRPDLVHTTLAKANAIGRFAGVVAGVPVVTSLVNVSYGPEYLRDPALRAWKVRTLNGCDATTARLVVRFHALTRHVADVMARRLLIPRDRIDVIPRGRDPQVLGTRNDQRRVAVRDRLSVGREDFLILAAARHERQKGLDVLLETMATVRGTIPEARLVVAGREGNQTQRLRDLISELHLQGRVELLGSRKDVPDLLCGADVLVVPSRWEGLGSVLIEAMALETPIIASDIPPIVETVGGVATLVPPGKPAAIAAALLAIRSGEATAVRGMDGRQRFADTYVLDRVCMQMLDFYQRALAR